MWVIIPFSFLSSFVLIVMIGGLMNYYTVFLAVAVFSCFIGGAVGAVSGVSADVEINDVEYNDRIISATITVENNSDAPIAQRYLGVYLLPLDFAGAETAKFVGWVALPYLRMGESITVPFTSVVPPGTVGGTYQMAALVTTSYGLSSPQFANVPRKEISIQGWSGSGAEMTTLPVVDRAHVAKNMPNYQITDISIPSSTSLYPGSRVTPSVSVVNVGGDAMEGIPVSVMLLLGDQVLYPEVATIPAIAAGKSAKMQLSYKIPDNIHLSSYSARGLVNPYGIIPEVNEGDNVFITPRTYFISNNWGATKVSSGGCGCGSK